MSLCEMEILCKGKRNGIFCWTSDKRRSQRARKNVSTSFAVGMDAAAPGRETAMVDAAVAEKEKEVMTV